MILIHLKGLLNTLLDCCIVVQITTLHPLNSGNHQEFRYNSLGASHLWKNYFEGKVKGIFCRACSKWPRNAHVVPSAAWLCHGSALPWWDTEMGCGGGNSFECLPTSPPPYCLPNGMEGEGTRTWRVKAEEGERECMAQSCCRRFFPPLWAEEWRVWFSVSVAVVFYFVGIIFSLFTIAE